MAYKVYLNISDANLILEDTYDIFANMINSFTQLPKKDSFRRHLPKVSTIRTYFTAVQPDSSSFSQKDLRFLYLVLNIHETQLDIFPVKQLIKLLRAKLFILALLEEDTVFKILKDQNALGPKINTRMSKKELEERIIFKIQELLMGRGSLKESLMFK